MNQLSENIGDRIGALELSDAVAAMNDGALENSAGSIYAGATVDQMGCPGGVPMTKSVIYCRRIDDGALEDSAAYASVTPSIDRCLPTKGPHCRGIDDSALEESTGYNAVGPSASPAACPTVNVFTCPRRIDDGALEEVAGAVYAGSTNNGPAMCTPPTWKVSGCPRIDDGAPEASAEMAMHPRMNWRNPMGECV